MEFTTEGQYGREVNPRPYIGADARGGGSCQWVMI
jgi:hypothetical protein